MTKLNCLEVTDSMIKAPSHSLSVTKNKGDLALLTVALNDRNKRL